jgi:hypothetical protein
MNERKVEEMKEINTLSNRLRIDNAGNREDWE